MGAFFCLESMRKNGTIEDMKISGVLVLFPITIFISFFVVQKQTMMEKPFERHAGAYTDLGHIIASIKNANKYEAPRNIIVPATIPRRNDQLIKQQLNIQTADISITKPTQGQAKNTENHLEEIWRDHISQNQAAPVKEDTFASTQNIKLATAVGVQASVGSGLLTPREPTPMEKAAIESKKEIPRHDASGFAGDKENYASLDVLVVGAEINNSAKEEKIENISFTYMADETSIINSEDGRFNFELLLANRTQSMSGIFQARNFVTTRVDLPMEVGSYGSLVPMVSIESLDTLLIKHEANVPGGFVLVDLDQEIIDVEIDKKYYKKVYLTPEFNESSADDSARFVMFLGVEAGNTTLRYLTRSRHIAERVSLVAADQILYDLPIITKSFVHSFGLYEMESLSLLPRELSLSGKNIRPFGQKNTAIQETLNYYTLEFIDSVLGSRNYTEVDHLGTTFFVGHKGNDKIVVPGQGFLNEVLAFHDMDRLVQDCLIQINLPSEKELFEITMYGEGQKGPLLLDSAYLNKDGTVSVDATEFSTNAFILGDMLGRINVKIKYTDDSIDMLNSVCAPSTYLVEHL